MPPDPVPPDRLQETVDYVAITRLQSAYADSVTRRAWAELEELFVPSATVTVDTVTSDPIELVGPTGVGDFISGAVERFEFFELVILNTTVDLRVGGDPDVARARVFTCELRQDASNGRWTNAFGVYHDEYRRIDGRWWFARRGYQSIARTGRAEIFPFPQPPEFD
ncbi:MAG TPA: nuclear transport factor 2 family protein [Acidimicrobiia bacterium]